jgi:hypothetical protein
MTKTEELLEAVTGLFISSPISVDEKIKVLGVIRS